MSQTDHGDAPSKKPTFVLGRPLQQPGETREQAAERLASEMLEALQDKQPPKREEPGSDPPAIG